MDGSSPRRARRYPSDLTDEEWALLEDGQKSAPVRTVGITAIHRTSLAPGLGHGQTDSYSTVQLAGTATNGVIPLQA